MKMTRKIYIVTVLLVFVLFASCNQGTNEIPSADIAGKNPLRNRLLCVAAVKGNSERPYKVEKSEYEDAIFQLCGEFGIGVSGIEEVEDFSFRVDFRDESDVSVLKGNDDFADVFLYTLSVGDSEWFALVTDDCRIGDVLSFGEGRREDFDNADTLACLKDEILYVIDVWNDLKEWELTEKFGGVVGGIAPKGVAGSVITETHGDWEYISAVEPLDGDLKKAYLRVPHWDQCGCYNDVFCLLHGDKIKNGSQLQDEGYDYSGMPATYRKLVPNQSSGCVIIAFAQLLSYLGELGLWDGIPQNEVKDFLANLKTKTFSDTDPTHANKTGVEFMKEAGICNDAGDIVWNGEWDWKAMNGFTETNSNGDSKKTAFMVSCFIAMILDYQKCNVQFFSNGGTSAIDFIFWCDDQFEGRGDGTIKQGFLPKYGLTSSHGRGVRQYVNDVAGIDTMVFFNSIKNNSAVAFSIDNHEVLLDGCVIRKRNVDITAVSYDTEKRKTTVNEMSDTEERRFYHRNNGHDGNGDRWEWYPNNYEFRTSVTYNVHKAEN